VSVYSRPVRARYAPTTIVSVRLTEDELDHLDRLGDNRSDTLRMLVGSAAPDSLWNGSASLPVLWWRLLDEMEQFHRRTGDKLAGVLRHVHREDYHQARHAFDAVLADWEPSLMVWPP